MLACSVFSLAQEHTLARFKQRVMSSVWICRICGTWASSSWQNWLEMSGNVGLVLQELRYGDGQHLEVTGALGGGRQHPERERRKGEFQSLR